MTNRKKILVVSHERSGTHFLMNSLAMNFGYAENRLDLDHKSVDWRNPDKSKKFLQQFAGVMVTNIFKSHHPQDFFSSYLDFLLEEFKVFYIYRDGRDVMTSFWRYILTVDWHEGPKTATVGEFMRAEPEGALCRYQINPAVNMLQRWLAHINSWIGYSHENLLYIRYEDLYQNFKKLLSEDISNFLALEPITLTLPTLKNSYSIYPWRGIIGNWQTYFTSDDIEFFQLFSASTMAKIGYQDQDATGE